MSSSSATSPNDRPSGSSTARCASRSGALPGLAREGWLDLLHVRDNAANSGAEVDVFPHLEERAARPGVVAFTATRWRKLLKANAMPFGQAPLIAPERYRFTLNQPAVDVVMTGPKNLEQMRENLSVLEQGPLGEEEMARARDIGDHVCGKPRR